jgi:hypothetical protein
MECASWLFQPSLNPATTCFIAASSAVAPESAGLAAAARVKFIARGIAKRTITIAANFFAFGFMMFASKVSIIPAGSE